MTKKKVHTLRVESDLFAYLELRAKRNRRSPTSELNALLAEMRDTEQSVNSGTEQSVKLVEQELQTEVPATVPTATPVQLRTPSQMSTTYWGVWQVGNRWTAEIRIEDDRYHIGDYDSAEAAARAYDDYVRGLPGHHRVNFPMEGEQGIDSPLETPSGLLEADGPMAEDGSFPCPKCGGLERCDCFPDGPGYFPDTTPGPKPVLSGGIRVIPSTKPPRRFTEDFERAKRLRESKLRDSDSNPNSPDDAS